MTWLRYCTILMPTSQNEVAGYLGSFAHGMVVFIYSAVDRVDQ